MVDLGKVWAIGSLVWRQTLAKEHAACTLSTGLPRAERLELREASWQANVTAGLVEPCKVPPGLKTKPLKQSWTIELALRVRRKFRAPISRLADNLYLGASATLRGYHHHTKQAKK